MYQHIFVRLGDDVIGMIQEIEFDVDVNGKANLRIKAP